MPTYIFKNTKTDEIFEKLMRISELDEFKKKNPDLVQMPTAPSFRLKGTGWYETDFKTGNKKNIAKSDNEGQSSKKSKDNQEPSTKKPSSKLNEKNT
mgnify:CR=1 FL=1|tara:strand:+ start:621 stop:911 length:291 start_codon:yes stop_codon:yes gene_type:complete